jgi:uracil-DNA glycosylase
LPLPEDGDFAGFVERVAERSFGAAFCMFREADTELECSDAPALRRANATAYLNARAGRAPLLLVGEAMGYAGGRFSGIAFTAERTLRSWGPPYRSTSVRPEGWAEQSGTIVHGALAMLGLAAESVLWNVVPAHPHRAGEPLSNRTPLVAELHAGAEVLAELIERLEPRATIAVGRSAERALAALGLACDASVRHPANGGATAFRGGLERYALSVR